jgi:hypothetical protein
MPGHRHDTAAFRRALEGVAPPERDAWLDSFLGLGEIGEDGPDLPRECVPYLPCPVDALLRMVDEAGVGPEDVFVDVGSGAGRAAALVHLLTGAAVVGIEVQHALASASRELSARLPGARFTTLEGDACALAASVAGTVYFLYCPFSGERLARLVDTLEPIARTRALRICCVDVPLPERSWLTLQPQRRGDLAVHSTTAFPATAADKDAGRGQNATTSTSSPAVSAR